MAATAAERSDSVFACLRVSVEEEGFFNHSPQSGTAVYRRKGFSVTIVSLRSAPTETRTTLTPARFSRVST